MRTTRRRAAIGVAVSALIGGLAIAGTTVPASAAAEDCPDKDLCLFQLWDYGSSEEEPALSFGYLAQQGSLYSDFNDIASSIVNNSVFDVCFYKDVDYGGGDPLRVAAGGRVARLENEWNDSISYYRIC